MIDRFEGDYACLEGDDRVPFNVKRAELPAGAREGDVLRKTDSGYAIDSEETARRQNEMRDLLDSLFSSDQTLPDR